MEIITKDNKKIDVSEDRVLTIPEGLLGFEEYTKYAIYESEFEPFLWLQSIENQKLAFLIIDPFLICSDYETDIDDETLAKLDISKPETDLLTALF